MSNAFTMTSIYLPTSMPFIFFIFKRLPTLGKTKWKLNDEKYISLQFLRVNKLEGKL